MAKLLLATVNGEAVLFDTATNDIDVVFKGAADEALMGISLVNGTLFIASLNRIYKIRWDDHSVLKKTKRYRPTPDFHQMNHYDGRLYTTATTRNQIWVYDLDLKRRQKVRIKPPIQGKRVIYKKNYNHINNIVKQEGKFYINLNWFTEAQYADSGVLVTDTGFRELDKFKYAWESHDFQFDGEKMMAICSTSSKDKKILHPFSSGLMVDGELVWEHDPDESFCKGLCHDDRFIYMCGGKKAERARRKSTRGVIYVIDKKRYHLVKKIENDRLMGIRGAIVLNSR